MKLHQAKLSEICGLVGASFVGEDVLINGLNLCNRPTAYNSILGYTTSSKFFDAIIANMAVKALVINQELYDEFSLYARTEKRSFSFIISESPEFLFYDIHNTLWSKTGFYDKYSCMPKIGRNCNIHSSVVIENGVTIGNNVTIGPNSVIRSGSFIEDNVYIGCCSVIGSEGFQAIRGYDKMVKHIGGTHLCHDVYVGDNATVGNALFEGMTEVGPYSKIDNHVHFAHNCVCGQNCVITACSLLMGSTVLKDNVWLAPNAVILNGKTIEDDGFVGTLAFVNKDVPAGVTVIGIPAKPFIK